MYRALKLFLLVVLSGGQVEAAGRTPFNADALVGKSDLVVAGMTGKPERLGSSTVSASDGAIPVEQFRVAIRVRKVFLGPTGGTVLVDFVLPKNASGSLGYRGVRQGSFRIFFLRSTGQEMVFADPSWPSIPGAAAFEPKRNKGVTDNILDNLAAVIAERDRAQDEVLESIALTRHYDSEALRQACRSRLADSNSGIRLECVASLVRHNDPTALAVVEDVLLHFDRAPWPHSINVVYAVRDGLADPRAIPVLERAFGSQNFDVRMAAIMALRRTGEARVLKTLKNALRDGNQEIRYAAVVGFAEITNQPEWRPLFADFRENEARYIEYWSDWAAANVQPK